MFLFLLGTYHRFKTVTGTVSVLFYLWREQQVCLHSLCPSEVLPDLKETDEHYLLSVFIDMVYVHAFTLTKLLLSHIELTHGFHLHPDRRRKKEKKNIITTSLWHTAVWRCSQRRGFPVSLWTGWPQMEQKRLKSAGLNVRGEPKLTIKLFVTFPARFSTHTFHPLHPHLPLSKSYRGVETHTFHTFPLVKTYKVLSTDPPPSPSRLTVKVQVFNLLHVRTSAATFTSTTATTNTQTCLLEPSYLSQFFPHAVNLVRFQSQACEDQQEQHQHHQGRAGAHPPPAVALPASGRTPLGRELRPAGYEARRLVGTLLASACVHQEHLREGTGLLAAHGRRCLLRGQLRASVTSVHRKCDLLHICISDTCHIHLPQTPPTQTKWALHMNALARKKKKNHSKNQICQLLFAEYGPIFLLTG